MMQRTYFTYGYTKKGKNKKQSTNKDVQAVETSSDKKSSSVGRVRDRKRGFNVL